MEIQYVGDRLRRVRKEVARLSQHDFARVLNTTQINICLLENNRHLPGSAFLLRLSQAYPINLHWLLTGKDSMSEGVIE